MSSQQTSRQWMVIFMAFALLAMTCIFALLYNVKMVREDITTSLDTQPQTLVIRAEMGVHHVSLTPQDDTATCGLTMGAVIKGVRATYNAEGDLTGGYFTRQAGLSSCEGEFWLSLDQLVGQFMTPFKRA